jgi:hypothetical protein
MSTSDARPEAGEDRWEAVRDLPPSAKLVAKEPEYGGPSTRQVLAGGAVLPARTVRYALTRLEEVGAVASRLSFTDARKRVYELTV